MTPSSKVTEKEEAGFVVLDVLQETKAEAPKKEQEEIEKMVKEQEVVSQEIEKLENLETPYELQCKLVLGTTGLKINGALEISQHFVSWEPIADPDTERLLSIV